MVNTTDEILGLQITADPKRLLYWTQVGIQGDSIKTLGDTGSCRNLMSYSMWDKLKIRPTLTPPGSTRIIAGNGEPLGLVGWITLRFTIAGHEVFHEVGIVKGLPVDFIIGGEFFFNHSCLLGFEKNFVTKLWLRSVCCDSCRANYRVMRNIADLQIIGKNRLPPPAK